MHTNHFSSIRRYQKIVKKLKMIIVGLLTICGLFGANAAPTDSNDASCHDWTRNEPVVTSRRSHGETWTTDNAAWKWVCNDGKITLQACISKDGTEVPVNKTLSGKDDLKTYKCWKNDKGQYQFQERGSKKVVSCSVNGKKYDKGEVFRIKNFMAKCTTEKLEVLACAFSHSNGSDVSLNPGDKLVDGTKTHVCTINDKTKLPRYALENSVCERSDAVYKKGDTWTERNYKLICNEKGFANILSCVTTTGEEIKLGEKKISKDGRVAFCQPIGNVVYYNEWKKGAGWNATRGGNGTKPKPEVKKEPCVDTAGAQYEIGANWTVDYMIYRCHFDNYRLQIGCTTRSPGRKQLTIMADQGLIANGVEYTCHKNPNTGMLDYKEKVLDAEKQKCSEDGATYKIGQTWRSDGKPFKYICNIFGAIEIIVCYAGDGTELEIGAKTTLSDGFIHQCLQEGIKFIYKTLLPEE